MIQRKICINRTGKAGVLHADITQIEKIGRPRERNEAKVVSEEL